MQYWCVKEPSFQKKTNKKKKRTNPKPLNSTVCINVLIYSLIIWKYNNNQWWYTIRTISNTANIPIRICISHAMHLFALNQILRRMLRPVAVVLIVPPQWRDSKHRELLNTSNSCRGAEPDVKHREQWRSTSSHVPPLAPIVPLPGPLAHRP